MSGVRLLWFRLASLPALGLAIGSSSASSGGGVGGSLPLAASEGGAAARLVRRESPAGFRDGGALERSVTLPPEEGIYPISPVTPGGDRAADHDDHGHDSGRPQGDAQDDEVEDAEGTGARGAVHDFEVVNKSNISVGPYTSLDHPSTTCEDNLLTGISFHSGQEASCLELVSYCNDTYFGERVTSRCKKTCGLCDIVVDAAEDDVYCMDAMPSDPPIFMMHEKMTDCRDLRAFCDTDSDVRWKCRASCGVCLGKDTAASRLHASGANGSNASNETVREKWVIPTPPGPTTTTSTEAPDLIADQVMGCSRRRFMGFCATRRRGI